MTTKKPKRPFQFKQFSVADDQCAMKVGTDGVLLGCWADLPAKPQVKLLDLGTGTGLIALICAQRFTSLEVNFHITALEKEPNAYAQACFNTKQSQWAEHISVVQGAVEDCLPAWSQQKTQFDVIIANPPYFQQANACKSTERDLARYFQQSHLSWLLWAETCLAPDGVIYFILPLQEGEILLKALQALPNPPLFCTAKTSVCGAVGKPANRLLLKFSQKFQPCQKRQFAVRDGNGYSPTFAALTKDFYLKL